MNKHFFRDLWIILSKTRRYGLKYLFSERYRNRIRNRRNRERRQRNVGSGFMSSRKTIKGRLINRDGKICQHCKHYFGFKSLSIDHIIKAVDGGTNDMSNLQLLCIPCHRLKDQILPKKERWENKPFAPFLEKLLDTNK